MGAFNKLKSIIGSVAQSTPTSDVIESTQINIAEERETSVEPLDDNKKADFELRANSTIKTETHKNTGDTMTTLPSEFDTIGQDHRDREDEAKPAPRHDITSHRDSAPSVDRTRSLGPSRRVDNISHIRSDLAQLNEDMSSGEQFYSQSLKRINNLINYAYETEANLSALEHLEPENNRLKEDLEKARHLANTEMGRAESFKSKSESYERRYLDTRQSLEQAQLSLAKAEGDCEALERRIADKEVEISGLTNSNRTIRNELTVDRQTQEALSAKNLNLASELSVALSEKLELEKRNLEATKRSENWSDEKLELERMILKVQNARRSSEEQNIALRGELEQVLADVKVFKNQAEQTDRKRSGELNALRAHVNDLQAEVQIKTETVIHAHEQMAELREKHDTAQRGRKNLLLHIEQQKVKTDSLSEAENSAKTQARAFNAQVRQLEAELEQLRRTNMMQSDKLKKYTSIDSISIPTPKRPQLDDLISSGPVEEQAQAISSDLAMLSQTSTSDAMQMIKEPLESRARRKAEREARSLAGQAKTTQALSMPTASTTAYSEASQAADHMEGTPEQDDVFSADTPSRAFEIEPVSSETKAIEDTLKHFHEIDLLG